MIRYAIMCLGSVEHVIANVYLPIHTNELWKTCPGGLDINKHMQHSVIIYYFQIFRVNKTYISSEFLFKYMTYLINIIRDLSHTSISFHFGCSLRQKVIEICQNTLPLVFKTITSAQA